MGAFVSHMRNFSKTSSRWLLLLLLFIGEHGKMDQKIRGTNLIDQENEGYPEIMT